MNGVSSYDLYGPGGKPKPKPQNTTYNPSEQEKNVWRKELEDTRNDYKIEIPNSTKIKYWSPIIIAIIIIGVLILIGVLADISWLPWLSIPVFIIGFAGFKYLRDPILKKNKEEVEEFIKKQNNIISRQYFETKVKLEKYR
jgi:hypothetical protein